MLVGFVQSSPALGDIGATLALLEPLLDRCAGAELVVLPELCNSGYDFATREQAIRAAESLHESRFLNFVRDRSRLRRFEIVTGFNELADGRLYNSAVLVTPDGVAGRYRKLHLFMNEKDLFAPGDVGLPIVERPFGRVGMLICFDWVFPEIWRVLALKGADIICHPSNLVIPGLAQRVLPIHALINRVFVVTANRVGTEGALTFTGRSLIADPQGELLAEAPATGEHVGPSEVDVRQARDKQVTARNHLFNDRRPAEYADLLGA